MSRMVTLPVTVDGTQYLALKGDLIRKTNKSYFYNAWPKQTRLHGHSSTVNITTVQLFQQQLLSFLLCLTYCGDICLLWSVQKDPALTDSKKHIYFMLCFHSNMKWIKKPKTKKLLKKTHIHTYLSWVNVQTTWLSLNLVTKITLATSY